MGLCASNQAASGLFDLLLGLQHAILRLALYWVRTVTWLILVSSLFTDTQRPA